MNTLNQSPTARRLVPLATIALLAVFVLGLVVGNLFLGAARAAGPVPQTPGVGRTITVSGVGEVKVQPDMAYLNFQVRTPGDTADAALAAWEHAAAALVAKLQARGVPEANIVENPPSTYPAPPVDGKPLPVAPDAGAGYISEGTIIVTMRDLASLRDTAMDGLKAGDGIGLSMVQYALQNDAASRAEAMNKAIDNARSQADAVATKLGLKVTTVAAVTVQPNYSGPLMAGGKGGDMATGMDPSAGLGQLGSRPDIVISLNVQVSYDFE